MAAWQRGKIAKEQCFFTADGKIASQLIRFGEGPKDPKPPAPHSTHARSQKPWLSQGEVHVHNLAQPDIQGGREQARYVAQ